MQAATKEVKKTSDKQSESSEFSDVELDALIEEKALYGRNVDSEYKDACGFSLFSIEVKRECLYKKGGFFDENPYRGVKPLVGKVVLDC